MIDRVANNKFNTEELNLHPTNKIREKLDFYRGLFGKTHDLSIDEFENLKQEISTFFNLKPGSQTLSPPPRLVRISNNNQILQAQGKQLSFLTDISQLLAPPIQYCRFGRCNIPGQQVLYCAVNEAGAYWETKPKNGDVITISHFQLKPGATVTCNIIKKERTAHPKISNQLQEVFHLLEDFLVEAYSLEVSKDKPRDYLFSGILSSDMLFYPVVSEKNIEAIIYPSVQKKKFGQNFAIRNDLVFERYDLIGVETRFILDEYENLDPKSDDVTTDQLIGSFRTTKFDFETGKILYKENDAHIAFGLFRSLQTGEGKQIRYEHPGIPKNIAFNLTPQEPSTRLVNPKKKFGRNDKVNVVYQNGLRKDNVKYKSVQDAITSGECRIVDY